MALQKYAPSVDEPSANMKSLKLSYKSNEKTQVAVTEGSQTQADVDIDLSEVYFLIMHFLSTGPCHITYGQFWNELLEHQLLPRRCHAWYSRTGAHSGDENENGFSFPLSSNKLVERYMVQYKSEPTETHGHSPWELYDADTQWEQPHIDDLIRDKMLRAFAKLEQLGNKAQDSYGVQKLKQVSQKLTFVNRFPVPLSLKVIQSRLENNYYKNCGGNETQRCSDAVKC